MFRNTYSTESSECESFRDNSVIESNIVFILLYMSWIFLHLSSIMIDILTYSWVISYYSNHEISFQSSKACNYSRLISVLMRLVIRIYIDQVSTTESLPRIPVSYRARWKFRYHTNHYVNFEPPQPTIGVMTKPTLHSIIFLILSPTWAICRKLMNW